MSDRCGYTVLDGDGIEQPCDEPTTGWRWYQDCGHEDLLERACDEHANEGGRRIHEAEGALATEADFIAYGVERGWLSDEWSDSPPSIARIEQSYAHRLALTGHPLTRRYVTGWEPVEP